MGRTENIEVFEHTKKLCKTHEVLAKAVQEATENQVLILENDSVSVKNLKIYKKPAKVVVSKKRSYEAASAYKDSRVCVLNFASASNPGGGVQNGSTAQEECLCRCSTLYFNLNTQMMWEGFYGPHRMDMNPLHNDDCIYTPGVMVFKTDADEPVLMKEYDWYQVNVITCAAPNLRERPSNKYNTGDGNIAVKVTDKDLFELHKKRMRRVLDIVGASGNEVVILGAFGCGAFLNPPEVVARAMKDVVEEYRYAFEVIEFAVYCSPKDDSNYKIFQRVLGKM